MIETIRKGRPGTAMMAFAGRLSERQIADVVDYIRQAFMRDRARNTRYHIPANGWYGHERRYHEAYPFALGEIPLDRPWEALTTAQRQGRRLFMQSCITCHEGRGSDRAGWDASAVSWPRGGYRPGRGAGTASSVDSVSRATPYAIHGQAPRLDDASPSEREGERLFQSNCAFCHAADGTGKGWIGRFLDAHPRDLTDRRALAGRTRDDLRRVIREGLPGTTMSAWRDVLDGRQIEAIIDYIARVFQPIPEGPAPRVRQRRSAASTDRPPVPRRVSGRDTPADGPSALHEWRRRPSD